MSRGLASPPPVSAGPAFLARGPRWGPPRDMAGRPFSTRDTRDSPDVAALSVPVVLHRLPHPTCRLTAATTNGPTDSDRQPPTQHNNCRSCRPEHGTCERWLLFVRHVVDCWAGRGASHVPDRCWRGFLKGYEAAPFGCAVTTYPG